MAKSTVSNRDVLVKLFQRIESFFERLKIYTEVPPSVALTDGLARILAEVLSILAIATKGVKEGRISESIPAISHSLLNYTRNVSQEGGRNEPSRGSLTEV